MRIDFDLVIERLKSFDDVLILTHQFPDGDTLGCGFALLCALRKLNKRAKIECSDPFGKQYSYITSNVKQDKFTHKFIVAVDVADVKLLGRIKEKYGECIDLCIDHHGSNVDFAKETYVDSNSAAACEIIYDIINALNVDIDKTIANALFTGISTDTGCFKYSNTTARTHKIAAALIEKGADHAEINRIMFDTKSKTRMMVEQKVLESMEFYHNDKIATIILTQDMIKKCGAEESELEGITSLPRMIEGVIIGITLREKRDGKFKVSVRTHSPIDAAKLCEKFGGGGHSKAAGCEFNIAAEDAKKLLLCEAIEMMKSAEAD